MTTIRRSDFARLHRDQALSTQQATTDADLRAAGVTARDIQRADVNNDGRLDAAEAFTVADRFDRDGSAASLVAQGPAAQPTAAGRVLSVFAARLEAIKPAPSAPLLAGLSSTFHDVATKAGEPLATFPTTVAGVPVASARALLFTGLTGNAELAQQGADVRFGKLSRAQFDALAAEFGGLSRVPYDAAREYTAVDFLPPAAQALVHRDIDVGPSITLDGTARLRETDDRDFSVSVSPNCHGTAWELMLHYQQPQRAEFAVHFGDAWSMGAKLDDAAMFKTVGRADPGKPPEFMASLRPGDVVSFYRHEPSIGDMDLLHSAVYAGGGLFFEKPDTEMDEYQETPYRLASWEQVQAPIARFLDGQPSAVARRPTSPLPAGKDAFASSDEKALAEWATARGTSLGKPLVVELEIGMGGGVRGVHVTALDTISITTGPDGRGRVG